MGRGRAFTLIELLVVIAIIALLVSILLPSLSMARELTRKSMCASNVRHIGVGLHMYATQDPKGHFPAARDGQNAALNSEIKASFIAPQPTPGGRKLHNLCVLRDKETGKGCYIGWGMLYPLKMIDSPEMFYCPSLLDTPHSWPMGWSGSGVPDDPYSPGWKLSSYVYRIFGQAQAGLSPPLTYEQIDELFNLEIDPQEALVADLFLDVWQCRGDPAHVNLPPYGLNVAYADGHAEWVVLGDNELNRLTYYSYAIGLARQDQFTYLYFRALGTRTFHEVDELYPAP